MSDIPYKEMTVTTVAIVAGYQTLTTLGKVAMEKIAGANGKKKKPNGEREIFRDFLDYVKTGLNGVMGRNIDAINEVGKDVRSIKDSTEKTHTKLGLLEKVIPGHIEDMQKELVEVFEKINKKQIGTFKEIFDRR